MNIIFIYDLDNKDYEDTSNDIEECLKNILKDTVVKVNRKNKTDTKMNPDVFVILSNDYKEVSIYYDKIKDKNKTVILTKNLASSNIIELIKYTKNVCYMKNDVMLIVRKIYNVYMESKD